MGVCARSRPSLAGTLFGFALWLSHPASGVAAGVDFSESRGFRDRPFALAIATDLPGGTIRYTLDGAAPATNSGRLYTGPIQITNTTVLRAIAHAPGGPPTPVATRTYLFIDDILRQSGMDPSIVTNDAYAQDLPGGLVEIPSVSIAGANIAGTFDEAPVSVELIYPNDPGLDVQVDTELKLTQAGAKPAYNLRFKTEVGPAKFRWNIFKHAPNAGEYTQDPRAYDRLHLKGAGNDWYGTGRRHALYIRDAWTRDSQIAVSGDGSHGMLVHLYRNGRYLGLFNLYERPDTWWAANHLGGTENDYYSPKFQTGSATSARLNYLNTVLIARDMAAPGHYAELNQYLDVVQFIDYLIVNFYAAVKDWHDQQDAFNTAPLIQTVPPGPLRYIVWDADQAWDLQGINPPFTFNLNFSDGGGRHRQICHAAAAHPDFRILFADRVYKHLFNEGALTVASSQRRWTNLVNAARNAILAEQARWGDEALPAPPTRESNWLPETQRVLGLMQSNVDEFIALLRSDPDGLYPPNDPPRFSRHGGQVPAGFSLSLSAGAGSLLFTADGSDPRLPGGAVSPRAQLYASPLVILSNLTLKARLRTGTDWSALAEAAFYTPQDLGRLAITEIMYNPPRLGAVDGDEFEFVELKNAGTNALDLTGLRFSEGIAFEFPPGARLQPSQFFVLVRNTNQFAAKYPGASWQGVYSGKLANEGERVTLATAWGAQVMSVEYNDRAPWPAAADGHDFSLVPLNPAVYPSSDRGDRWRASAQPGGSPGADDPPPTIPAIVVNEVLAAPPGASPGAPASDAIELYNPHLHWVDLSGWFLTDEADTPRKFRIPDATAIPPNGFLVFTEADFNRASDASNRFALSQFGDQVYLFSANASGGLTGYTHGFGFGASEPGISFGRFLTSTEEAQYPPQTGNSFGARNSSPRFGPVVLSEIHYHPSPGASEFVEIQNLADEDVPLYDPVRSTNTWKLSGLGYAFPAGITLTPRGLLLLVAVDPSDFCARHAVRAGVQILGPWAGTLEHSGELLELQRPGPPDINGLVPYYAVDSVRYNDKPPWPIDPDGLGPSLERIDAAAYGNDPINWRASGTAGGTPGIASAMAAGPMLAVGQPLLETSALVGENAKPEVFHVWNVGVGTLDYSVAVDAHWLTVFPDSGSLLNVGLPQQHELHFATAALPPGLHAVCISLTAPDAVPSQRSLIVVLEVRIPGSFMAYNDFGWKPGQSADRITTHTTADGGGGGDGGGPLVDFATGQPSSITLSIAGGAFFGEWQADLGRLSEPGTDAYGLFNGRVDCRGFLSFASADLLLEFSGLDPAERYEVALFGNCDIPSYPDRFLTATIEGARSFVNSSTAGAILAGTRRETTIAASGYNTPLGQVIRYTAIAPLRDGQFRLRIPAATAAESGRFYLNALRFATVAQGLPPQLRLLRAGDDVLALCWAGPDCTLEQAPDPRGPWTANPSQANPQTVPAHAGAVFFRLAR